MNRFARILAIALTVSLALNLFLAGFWAARGLRRLRTGAWDGPWAAREDVQAPRLGQMLRRRGAAVESSRVALGAARVAVRDALTAEPFSSEALEGALAKLRTETAEAQVAFHRSLVEAAKEMTPEERRSLAQSPWFSRLDRHPR